MSENELGTNESTSRGMIAAIIAISAVASAFIFWLVYYHAPVDVSGTKLLFLPALNAVLNALSAIALVIGYRYIMARQIVRHRASMFVAFIFSTLFLVSYLTNYALHGETHFPVAYPIARLIYLWVLLTPHIILAVFALPVVLITFFFSLSGRFAAHKRIARWTYPLWLYVSVSGVVVYAMLAAYR